MFGGFCSQLFAALFFPLMWLANESDDDNDNDDDDDADENDDNDVDGNANHDDDDMFVKRLWKPYHPMKTIAAQITRRADVNHRSRQCLRFRVHLGLFGNGVPFVHFNGPPVIAVFLSFVASVVFWSPPTSVAEWPFDCGHGEGIHFADLRMFLPSGV